MNINEAIEQLKYYQSKPYVPTVKKVCNIALETIEALQQENNDWQERYYELDAGHSRLFKDFCKLQQENEQLRELAKAKADGRLVELPCKIGDEVWFLEKQLDIANGTCSTVISEYIVTEIRGNKYNPLWYMASSERCTHRDFHPTELGKTVFLTREEAEKAIGGGQ